ncbi:post-transcriptional regulator [Spiroplasma endosymbiont of Cantharis nigra]|uniref:post-transcriptional regulator n=1 Tax=Spiroplasma endosymbiont of Cantharis nigra TaxID=3066278 RepID=UPI0030CEFC5A
MKNYTKRVKEGNQILKNKKIRIKKINFFKETSKFIKFISFFVYNYDYSGDLMEEENLKKIIYEMLDLKLTEIRKEFSRITLKDLYCYLKDVVFKNNKIVDLNDLSFFIMNIKINKIFEYLNVSAILDENNSIEMDLKIILER